MRAVIVAALALVFLAACEVAPAPTNTPLPPTETPLPPTTKPTPFPWEGQWDTLEELNQVRRQVGGGTEIFDGARGVFKLVKPSEGQADLAFLFILCSSDSRVPEVRMAFSMPELWTSIATAEAGFSSRERATAVARVKRAYKIDDVHISRRNMGEAGRWMKSGFNSLLENGGLRLWQTPAAAFIHELSQVEEFAVLITDDYGRNTTAVFDVRGLGTALASDEVGWEC